MLTTDAVDDAMPPAADDLVRALLAAGWTLTKGSKAPTHRFRPTADSGLTVWMSASVAGIILDFDVERRRLGDGTVRPPWHAQAFGPLPATVLAAVAVADAAAGDEQILPGGLLAAAGWIQSPHWHREWATPDGERELNYDDDQPDCADVPWCVVRHDLEAEVSASDSTPASVIAAFALTAAG